MATIKSYTDLNQSRRLAEVLPHKSADMFIADVFLKEEQTHSYKFHFLTTWGYKNFDELKERENKFVQFIPCWSLAALLEIIKKPTAFDLLINGRGCRCHCTEKQEGKFYGTDDYCNTPIDACIEVIIKLHEQKIL